GTRPAGHWSPSRLERSETMMLGAQEPQTEKGTGQTEERLVDLCASVQAASQPPERLQPGEGPLHDPAEHAPPAAVLPLALGQDRDAPQPAQPLPYRLCMVTAVAVQAVRLLAPGADARAIHDRPVGARPTRQLRNLSNLAGASG